MNQYFKAIVFLIGMTMLTLSWRYNIIVSSQDILYRVDRFTGKVSIHIDSVSTGSGWITLSQDAPPIIEIAKSRAATQK